MGLRTFSSCLLAAAVLALPAAAIAAPAAPSPTGVPLKFDVTTGPKDDIKCVIDATLYTPANASKDNPVPAILATNGFGGSKHDFDKLGAAYAKRGFAFLAYSGLGFGVNTSAPMRGEGSTCKIYLDDPDYDGKAGSQLVSFLGGSKAAQDGTKVDYVIHDAVDHDGNKRDDDPRVGMTGGSYGGQIQFAIAGVDPRVDTLQPQITWSDLSYSLGANNTDFTSGVTYNTPGVTKLDWPVLFFGLGVADGFGGALQQGDTSHLDGQCPNFNDNVCLALIQAGARGYADKDTLALLRHASVFSYIDKIKIPVFLRQGEHDSLFNLQEAVANYRSLLAQGTPVKMLWRSAGHSGGDLKGQEQDSTNLEASYESREELQWFRYYLAGTGDAPVLDFQFLRDWALPASGDAGPAIGSTPSYPAANATTLFLSGSSDLVGSAGAAKAVSAPMASVPGSATGQGGAAQEAPAIDPPGQSVSFSSAALPADTDVVGVPSVTLSVDAPLHAQAQGADPATKLVLIAKLYDDDGKGGSVLPANLVSAARIADVTKPFTIELPGIAHRFAAGHKLRLTIATANATSRNSLTAGPVTVTGGSLKVPELGGPLGAPGSGPSGSTPFTASSGAPTPIATGTGKPATASRYCGSGRRFTITLPRARKGDRIVSTKVTLNGRKLKVARSARTAVVDLRKQAKGTYKVKITRTFKKAKAKHSTRTYHTCAKAATAKPKAPAKKAKAKGSKTT